MSLINISFSALLAVLSSPALTASGQDTPGQAAVVKEKLQTVRANCAKGRRQVAVTIEELSRLTVPDVELRPQFEKFKAELVKMEEVASSVRERADSMKAKGEKFFSDAEDQVFAIQNPDIRKAAEKRLSARKKSYGKVLSTIQEAKAEFEPFMSDLHDLKKMFDSELTTTSVKSAKDLLRQARWHGNDVNDALEDVEKNSIAWRLNLPSINRKIFAIN